MLLFLYAFIISFRIARGDCYLRVNKINRPLTYNDGILTKSIGASPKQQWRRQRVCTTTTTPHAFTQ